MKKQLLYLVGFLSLGLGIIGAFLPVMPTTCFVLLSAWCFAKTSPRWHQRLVNSRLFGRMIKQWEADQCIPPKARWIAISSIILFGSFSFIIIENTIVRVTLVILIVSGIASIHFFRQCDNTKKCPISAELPTMAKEKS